MFKLPASQGGQALLIRNGRPVFTQAGQALLLVVLSLAVVLTVVLSILARSVTDIKISTGSEESLRAFSAAEAGIETGLNSLIVGDSSGDLGGASFESSVTKVGEGSSSFIHPSSLFSGETSLFWFVAHDVSGNLVCNAANDCFTGSSLQVCWGKPGTSASLVTTPAIEASIVYAQTAGNYATLRIARDTADPNATRRASNSFSTAGGACSLGTETFAFQKTLDFSAMGISSFATPNVLQFLVIRMLYNTAESHPVGISTTGGLLPSQGFLVESSGVSGDANRRLNVFQGYGEPPLPFGAVIFSPPGITK